jgi:hypothetical protein
MLPENDRRTLAICGAIVALALVGLFVAMGLKHSTQTELAKVTPTPSPSDQAKQSSQPPFDGIEELGNHGASHYQLDDIKAAFDKYKNQSGGKVTSVQIDTESVQSLPRDPKVAMTVLTVSGTFNNHTPYTARAELTDITAARLVISDSGGKQLYDAGKIDLYNGL